jgi:hypothetical protein
MAGAADRPVQSPPATTPQPKPHADPRLIMQTVKGSVPAKASGTPRSKSPKQR